MREIVLGTAGHVDHGKTSLVRALTGINTDRLIEEQKRGITIELGFAFLDLPCGHRLGIVDVPGHERFVRNMVAGAAGIDLVAMIVAADEGVMPQTREHLEICQLLGVERGLVVITKKDLVDEEWLDLVTEEVREYFSRTFLAGAPVVTVSSASGEGLDRVVALLDELVRGSDFTEAGGPFRLPIDRVFSMKGFGAVITGTAISGRIGVGEAITVYPANLSGKVRNIQVHGEAAQFGEAGHRTAVNIGGIDKEKIERGQVAASPGCLAPTYVIDADFTYLAGNDKPLKNRSRVRVHIGTAEVIGRILLLESETLEPGGSAAVQLLLEKPVGIWPGDRYVVRSYSPVRTIGGGRCHANVRRKRPRLRGESATVFAAYRGGRPEELAILHLDQAGPAGVVRDLLAVKLGVFGNRLKKLLDPLISAKKILVIESDSGRLTSAAVLAQLGERLLAALEDYHRNWPLKGGVGQEELRELLHLGNDPKLFQFLLRELGRGEKIVVEEGTVRLAGHVVRLAVDEEKLRQRIVAIYAEAALTPPRLAELLEKLGEFDRKQVLDMHEVLHRQGILVRVSEELWFEAQVLSRLQESLVAFLKDKGEIDAQGFKTLTGITRKFSIPLLEYFDRQKLTIRVGDRRLLR
ncbi:MAG: selenocysteine-specific translation elongation factor [Thermodesulfobacteriota bacterium]